MHSHSRLIFSCSSMKICKLRNSSQNQSGHQKQYSEKPTNLHQPNQRISLDNVVIMNDIFTISDFFQLL